MSSSAHFSFKTIIEESRLLYDSVHQALNHPPIGSSASQAVKGGNTNPHNGATIENSGGDEVGKGIFSSGEEEEEEGLQQQTTHHEKMQQQEDNNSSMNSFSDSLSSLDDEYAEQVEFINYLNSLQEETKSLLEKLEEVFERSPNQLPPLPEDLFPGGDYRFFYDQLLESLDTALGIHWQGRVEFGRRVLVAEKRQIHDEISKLEAVAARGEKLGTILAPTKPSQPGEMTENSAKMNAADAREKLRLLMEEDFVSDLSGAITTSVEKEALYLFHQKDDGSGALNHQSKKDEEENNADIVALDNAQEKFWKESEEEGGSSIKPVIYDETVLITDSTDMSPSHSRAYPLQRKEMAPDPRASIDRTEAIHHAQLLLQLDFRSCEQKVFENEIAPIPVTNSGGGSPLSQQQLIVASPLKKKTTSADQNGNGGVLISTTTENKDERSLSLVPYQAGEERAEQTNNIATTDSQSQPQLLSLSFFHKKNSLLAEKNDYSATRRMQSKQLALLDTQNSQQNFRGYIHDVQKKQSILKLIGGMNFIVVPEGDYCLGKENGETMSTMTPAYGSKDRSSRLDRRTQYWLLSEASSVTEGIEYMDGPQHFMYTTRGRVEHVPAMFVAKQLMTKSQLRKLLLDRRFKHLESIVSPYFYRDSATSSSLTTKKLFDDDEKNEKIKPPTTRRFFTPTLLGGKFHDYMVEDVVIPENEKDDTLEVPYFVAEEICRALGGVVCPVDVWEAGMRGLEGYEHPFDNRDIGKSSLPPSPLLSPLGKNNTKKTSIQEGNVQQPSSSSLSPSPSMQFQSLWWEVLVDKKSRKTRGVSTRLTNLYDFKKKQSACQFENIIRSGHEWNSVYSFSGAKNTTTKSSSLTVGGENQRRRSLGYTHPSWLSPLADETMPFLPHTHILRSCTDYNTQLILDGEVYAVENHSDLDGVLLQREDKEPMKIQFSKNTNPNGDDVPRQGGGSFEEAKEEGKSKYPPKHGKCYDNRHSFIGPAMYSYGLPNRGIPVAGFRIAFPAQEHTSIHLQRLSRSDESHRGMKLKLDALVRCLGVPKPTCSFLHRVFYEDVSVDPLYGGEALLFLAAGFDTVFAKAEPKPFKKIVLHAQRSAESMEMIERKSFSHPISTDHTPSVNICELRGKLWEKYLEYNLKPRKQEAQEYPEGQVEEEEEDHSNPFSYFIGGGYFLAPESEFRQKATQISFVDTMTVLQPTKRPMSASSQLSSVDNFDMTARSMSCLSETSSGGRSGTVAGGRKSKQYISVQKKVRIGIELADVWPIMSTQPAEKEHSVPVVTKVTIEEYE